MSTLAEDPGSRAEADEAGGSSGAGDPADRGDRGTVYVVDAEGARYLALDRFPDMLATLGAPEAPVTWIHGQLSDDVVACLEEFGLHELALKSLRDGPERPRVEEYPDHLYVSLLRARGFGGSGAVDEGPAAGRGAIHVDDLRAFVGPRWLVSLGAMDGDDLDTMGDLVLRQVARRGRGPSFALYYLAEWSVSTLYPVLDDLDDRVDSLEDMVLLDVGEETRQELFRLKRDLVELRRRVAPTRDVMQRLSSRGSDLLEPGAEVFFRDVHDDVLLVIEQLDTHRDILASALDLHLSTVSNRLNEIMKRLTVFATIFMPLTFITGLFGMNFTSLPIRSVAWFWLTLASMLLLAVSMVWYAWRRRWL